MEAWIVYLISANHDVNIKIIDKAGYDYLVNGTISDSIIKDIVHYYRKEKMTVEEAKESLECSVDQINERAMAVESARFNGKQFDGFLATFKEVVDFINKHKLDLQQEQYNGFLL